MIRITKALKSTLQATPLVVAFLLLQPGITAADPKTSTNMSSRLGYVERLLTESSAARKIDESADPEALDLKAQATSHFDNARRANDRDDSETAQTELREAIRLMTAAVQAANGDAAVSSKDASDFARRRESVKALADAHDRIASEKGEKRMNNALQEQVAAELTEADALLASGNGDEARAKLDGTYETVKASLEGLRGGDTLVRELSFETKAEEYEYELDRNDTHQMLVQVLLAEKLESSPMRASAEKFIGEAEDLRSQAEAAAGKEKYEEAIGLLERSTKELIRAIRSAGVYIPG
jgi:hypothetical protein